MADQIKDGGAAFPVQYDDGGCQTGMTLRDYFAGKVLVATISNDNLVKSLTVKMTESDADMAISNHCYMVADAMLKAREVSNG